MMQISGWCSEWAAYMRRIDDDVMIEGMLRDLNNIDNSS